MRAYKRYAYVSHAWFLKRRLYRGAEPANAAEAAMRALTEKKVSTKVNYSVLQNLFSIPETKQVSKSTETAMAAAAVCAHSNCR